MPAFIVRFRPTGPWRFGPDSGARDRVDLIFHSDSLYAAVTHAMRRLDLFDDWLQATALHTNGGPAVRFSSLFPFQRDLLYVTPPRSMWPPPPSTRIRYKSARFVPLAVVQSLVAEKPIDENRWIIDAESQCMIPSGEGPFRMGLRSAAAIDRLNASAAQPHTTACLEFTRDAGLWAMVVFADEAARDRWQPRVRSALRLLADSGFGGERSRGWGRSSDPEWNEASELWPEPETEKAYWLLSVFAPAESDAVDWKTGNYSTVTRTGRIESAASWGAVKTPSLMIAEGSVLVAPAAPKGEARNVAPSDFEHPVYRAGFAVTIPIPWRAPGAQRLTAQPVEQVSRPAVEQVSRPVEDEPVQEARDTPPAPVEEVSGPVQEPPGAPPAPHEPPQPESTEPELSEPEPSEPPKTPPEGEP